MGMTREQMKAGLQRLFVIQYFKDDEKAAYGEVIYEACSWMDSYRFDSAVKEVLKTLKTNQRLKPAHFLGAYRQLAENNGWSKVETKTCASCGGINFVYIWVRDKKGHEFRATKGCPECNPKYNTVHPDFTEIPRPDDAAPIDHRAKIKTIPSFMAQCLLNIADFARISMKEDLSNDLMEAAAQPGLKKYSPGKYDEAKRKNELVRALLNAPPPKVVDAGTAEEEPATTEPPPAQAEQPSPAAPTVITADEEDEPEKVVF